MSFDATVTISSTFPPIQTLNIPSIQWINPYKDKGLSAGAKAGIAIGVVFGVLLLACLGFGLFRRKRGKKVLPEWNKRLKPQPSGSGESELPTTANAHELADPSSIDALPTKKRWWSARDVITSSVFEKPSRYDTKKSPIENIAELDGAPPEVRKAELPATEVARSRVIKGDRAYSEVREGDVRILSPNFMPDFGNLTDGRQSRVTMIGLGDEIGVYLREMDRTESFEKANASRSGTRPEGASMGRDVLSENLEKLRVKKELAGRVGGI